MIKFRYFSELFDTHLPYEKHPQSDKDLHFYSIHHDAGKHVVMINHAEKDGKKQGHVAFMDKDGEMGATGNHKKNSHRILGTVRKIVQDHAKEHKLDSVHFDADKSDGGRAKLYSRMANKEGKNKETDGGKVQSYSVQAKKD